MSYKEPPEYQVEFNRVPFDYFEASEYWPENTTLDEIHNYERENRRKEGFARNLVIAWLVLLRIPVL